MEKFGIFELLDALSALTAAPPEEKRDSSSLDSAYLPPDYARQNDKAQKSPSTQSEQIPDPASEMPKAPHPETDALAGFYARHNAVAKKAGKK